MKLSSISDKISFLSDINRLDLINESIIDKELFELLVKKRKPILKGLKDMQQSRITKVNWIKHRWRFLKGIRKFHRSIKGKKLHRALSNFLTTGLFSIRSQTFESFSQDQILKAVSSIKTHVYIEAEYYMPLDEHLDFLILFDYTIPQLSDIELKLFKNEDLSREDIELLLRLVDKNEFHKSIAKITKKNTNDIDNDISVIEGSLDLEDSFTMTIIYESYVTS